MGFLTSPSIIKEEPGQEANNSYSSVFCLLVDHLQKMSELKEKDL